MERELSRLEGFERRRRGRPAAPHRLDHCQGLERLGRIAQALMSAMEPLAFLLGKILGPAPLDHAGVRQSVSARRMAATISSRV